MEYELTQAEKDLMELMEGHPDINSAKILIEIAKIRINMELEETGGKSALIRFPWDEKVLAILINLED
jgi:hypothetical protein